jgi:hypothetical protein
MKNNNSKRARKIIIGILIAILVIISAVLFWQRENLRLALDVIQHSEEELIKKLNKSKDKVNGLMTDYGLEPVYTDENPDGEPAAGSNEEPPASPSPSPSPAQKNNANTAAETASEIVSRYVSQMQALKGGYLGQLDSLMSRAVADYVALPKENRGKGAIQAIAQKYIGTAYSLQSNCDAQVNSVLSSLERELKAVNADTAIVSAMRSAYQNEKSAKIAYYMGKLK